MLAILPIQPILVDSFVLTPSKSSSQSSFLLRVGQEEEPIASGRILSPEYFKSAYECTEEEEDMVATKKQTKATTPWDIGGRPQPAIIKAYEEGQLRGRILDAGCGSGENCIYLANKYGITDVVGCDLAQGAILLAKDRVERIEQVNGDDLSFWTKPSFFVASCTELGDKYYEWRNVQNTEHNDDDDDDDDDDLFDVSIDSGLLHCLSDDDAQLYVQQLSKLIKPNTGRAYVGCFSTRNPSKSWDNPRRLSSQYLENLFCKENGWEVVEIRDTWWARPQERGSKQGSFSMALWMTARRI